MPREVKPVHIFFAHGARDDRSTTARKARLCREWYTQLTGQPAQVTLGSDDYQRRSWEYGSSNRERFERWPPTVADRVGEGWRYDAFVVDAIWDGNNPAAQTVGKATTTMIQAWWQTGRQAYLWRDGRPQRITGIVSVDPENYRHHATLSYDDEAPPPPAAVSLAKILGPQ